MNVWTWMCVHGRVCMDVCIPAASMDARTCRYGCGKAASLEVQDDGGACRHGCMGTLSLGGIVMLLVVLLITTIMACIIIWRSGTVVEWKKLVRTTLEKCRGKNSSAKQVWQKHPPHHQRYCLATSILGLHQGKPWLRGL